MRVAAKRTTQLTWQERNRACTQHTEDATTYYTTINLQ